QQLQLEILLFLSPSSLLSVQLARTAIFATRSLKMPEMFALKPEEQCQLQLVEREDFEDEDDLFEAIDKLISHGINAGDVKKLQDAGIYTCNGLMMHTKKNLTGIKGLSEAKVDKICEAAEKIVNFGYITGSDALLRRKAVVKITTGSQALDELLGGGIETLAITEAFGEFRSGKTQLAHTLCVSTQLPTGMRGGNGKVAYIDTEGTFRPDRIVPIAERFGMDPGAVLDNIIYARAYTYEHQYNLLLGLAAKMSEEPFRLLIVDSVIALFRVDFTGRGELAERQQKLAQMLSRLLKIAEEFNVAVYMTNQVISDPGGGVFVTDPKKPAGGHVLAHAATIRLMFRKGKGEQRVCKGKEQMISHNLSSPSPHLQTLRDGLLSRFPSRKEYSHPHPEIYTTKTAIKEATLSK
ncbi:hypothetical protein V2J09_014235, partial [Rumex salicifolius]